MATKGAARSFDKKFKFVVECDGIASTGFQKVGGLEVEAAVVEYYEGGALIPNKSPGRLKFSDIQMDRGATRDSDLHSWFLEVAKAASNAGLIDDEYKRTLDIVQQDRDGATLVRYRVYGAWPTKYMSGDWDNESDEVRIESVTISYDYFEVLT